MANAQNFFKAAFFSTLSLVAVLAFAQTPLLPLTPLISAPSVSAPSVSAPSASVPAVPKAAQESLKRLSDGTLALPPAAPVTDLSATLAPQTVAQLTQRLAEFEQTQGTQIALLLVPSTQPEPIADFTNRVGAAWKIGRRGVGDGVLIVVAVQDRKGWISVARTLEGAIPDVLAARIARETMAPHFKTGDYAGGLNATLDRLFQLIKTEGLTPPDENSLPPWALLLLVVLFVVISIARQHGGGQVVGRGRNGAPIFIPGGWGGGGGRAGGWSSGGGGDFSGGGGGGNW